MMVTSQKYVLMIGVYQLWSVLHALNPDSELTPDLPSAGSKDLQRVVVPSQEDLIARLKRYQHLRTQFDSCCRRDNNENC